MAAAQLSLFGSFAIFFIQGVKHGDKDFKRKHAITIFSSMKSAQVRILVAFISMFKNFPYLINDTYDLLIAETHKYFDVKNL